MALHADFVTMVEDRPIMSLKYSYSFLVIFVQNWTRQQSHGLFATAKLLVYLSRQQHATKRIMFCDLRKPFGIQVYPTSSGDTG